MARAFQAAAGTANESVYDGHVLLHGVNITEAAATPAAAEVVIRDGDGGDVLVRVKLGEEESVVVTPPSPLVCESGVFVDRVSGETEVIAWLV